MTDPEITALAREYAEEEGKHDIEQGFGESFFKDMLEFNEKEFKSVLEFLLRRFCLVERSKVETLYNITWNEWNFTNDVGTREQSKLILDTLKSLFPEIAKEVEP